VETIGRGRGFVVSPRAGVWWRRCDVRDWSAGLGVGQARQQSLPFCVDSGLVGAWRYRRWLEFYSLYSLLDAVRVSFFVVELFCCGSSGGCRGLGCVCVLFWFLACFRG
jgi:hypothetical protein